MFTTDTSQFKQYEDDLKRLSRRSIPFATKNTVNTAAFETQKVSRLSLSKELILRNPFTLRSVQVEQTRTLNMSRQAAFVGSVADYMEKQEFGAVKASRGSEGVNIPTGYSAGQRGQTVRTRLPRKPNAVKNIRLSSGRVKAKNRRQKNLILVMQAANSSNKFIFMDLGRRKGIFKVVGGKRSPKVRMVHDLTRRTVRIPRKPWLLPATDKVIPMMSRFYRDSLQFQLKRLRTYK